MVIFYPLKLTDPGATLSTAWIEPLLPKNSTVKPLTRRVAEFIPDTLVIIGFA